MPTDSTLAERDKAIESVNGLIWQVVRRHERYWGGCADDAYQECISLLCETWPQYDPSKSAFTTWARFTCKRHLRRCYAMGKIDSPIMRVAIHAFERGERVSVFSIHAGDDEYPLVAREIKTDTDDEATKEIDFIRFAESLVGRNLSPIEHLALVERFMQGSRLSDIAKHDLRVSRQTIGRRLNDFATEARRKRDKAMGKQHASV